MGCQFQIDLTVQVNEHTFTKPAEPRLKKVPYAPSAPYVFVLIQPIWADVIFNSTPEGSWLCKEHCEQPFSSYYSSVTHAGVTLHSQKNNTKTDHHRKSCIFVPDTGQWKQPALSKVSTPVFEQELMCFKFMLTQYIMVGPHLFLMQRRASIHYF